MNHLIKLINERIIILESIIQEKKKQIERAPQGIINVAKTNNRVQYYYKKHTKDKKKYLKKSEHSLVQAVYQKEYNEKVLDKARKEHYHLNQLINLYQKGTCEQIYEQLDCVRKEWVHPIALSDEKYIDEWLKQEYLPKGFSPDAPEYYTDNGERVRSKSEILIANALRKHNVPYRYETPLFLKGYGTIHPDFKILNVRERKEYYWEHMGKMDDPEYVEKALQRIDAYQKNHIFPGEKLLLSHETFSHPLDTRNIERLIMKYLI